MGLGNECRRFRCGVPSPDQSTAVVLILDPFLLLRHSKVAVAFTVTMGTVLTHGTYTANEVYMFFYIYFAMYVYICMYMYIYAVAESSLPKPIPEGMYISFRNRS